MCINTYTKPIRLVECCLYVQVFITDPLNLDNYQGDLYLEKTNSSSLLIDCIYWLTITLHLGMRDLV